VAVRCALSRGVSDSLGDSAAYGSIARQEPVDAPLAEVSEASQNRHSCWRWKVQLSATLDSFQARPRTAKLPAEPTKYPTDISKALTSWDAVSVAPERKSSNSEK